MNTHYLGEDIPGRECGSTFFGYSMLLFSKIGTLCSQMQCPMRTRLEVSRSKPGLKVILPTGDGVRDLPTWKTACHCLKKSWHVTNLSIAGAIAEKQFRNTASDMEKWDLKFLDWQLS